RKEFSKQAPSFGEKGLTLSSQEILNWIVGELPLQDNFRVLDIAAGTGHLSRAIAPHVKEVTAIDITPEMLAESRKEAARFNLGNIVIEEGNAEDLPYKDNSFDLVVSRLAIHHFEKPAVQFSEMVRVCKPDHYVGVIDLLSSDDDAAAATYNQLENMRDPSHVHAFSKTAMKRMMEETGLTINTFESRDIKVDFQRWVQMTGTEPDKVKILQTRLMGDIGESNKTGMRPFIEKGTLKFLQVWAIVIGTKNIVG
ncbi:MAG: class I SAM-dependent methyltransferase, partial [Chloroflexota bacterium]